MALPVLDADEICTIPPRPTSLPSRLGDQELRSFEQLVRAADAVALARRRGLEELREAAMEQGGDDPNAALSLANRHRALLRALEALAGEPPPEEGDDHSTLAWLVRTLGPMRTSNGGGVGGPPHAAEAMQLISRIRAALDV